MTYIAMKVVARSLRQDVGVVKPKDVYYTLITRDDMDVASL